VRREKDPIDDYVRMLPVVSDEHVRSSPDTGAKQALFEEIMMMATTTEQPGPAAAPAPPRRLKRLTAFAAGLGTVAVAGTAWAIYTGTGSTAASGCYITPDSVTVIDAVTGDPAKDCASAWERETGAPPPPLAAYDNGTGGVAVVAAGTKVPGDWTRLEPGPAQDPALIRLQSGLDDSIDGLRSDCHRLEAARTIADREIAAAGLRGWRVISERGEADGRSSCSYYIIEAQSQRVVLIPSDGLVTAAEDAPHARMAAALRDRLADGCLSSGEAAAAARKAADTAGVEGLVLHQLPATDVRCALVNMRVGGAVVVIVTGG
jgi:hypothetical protein